MDHGIVIRINTSNEKVLQAVVEHIVRNLRQNQLPRSVIGTIEPSVAVFVGERSAIEAIKGLLCANDVSGRALLFHIGKVGNEFFDF